MSVITIKSTSKCFGGLILECTHTASTVQCQMNFHIYKPPKACSGEKVPVVFFLSGLTCNDTNFIFKAGAMAIASQLGLALVCPDTSPRGVDVPNGDSWDFGQGAGFYLNATEEPFAKHFRMYDYIVKELPSVLIESFAKSENAWLLLDSENTLRQSIFGHSMGGLGALVVYLRNLELYHSCSAFSPISNPTDIDCAWGQKALKGYLGDSEESRRSLWAKHDPSVILSNLTNVTLVNDILVDQGTEDKFLHAKQLQVEKLEAAAKKVGAPLTLRMQEGYDHSYYFIQTFVKDHLEHHAKFLNL